MLYTTTIIMDQVRCQSQDINLGTLLLFPIVKTRVIKILHVTTNVSLTAFLTIDDLLFNYILYSLIFTIFMSHLLCMARYQNLISWVCFLYLIWRINKEDKNLLNMVKLRRKRKFTEIILSPKKEWNNKKIKKNSRIFFKG